MNFCRVRFVWPSTRKADGSSACLLVTKLALIALYYKFNDLQLNANKSEVVILGTAPQLLSAATICAVDVAAAAGYRLHTS